MTQQLDNIEDLERKIQMFERRIAREKLARKQAEALLEQKSLELYEANQELVKSHHELDARVKDRTEKLTQANHQLLKEMSEREQLNRRMLELSHQAGKAEIATGVLHNVGNVLNSVNVSASVIDTLLTKFQIESLKKSVGILKEQKSLAHFFEEDSRGKIFPQFLERLSESMDGQVAQARIEIDSLIENIEHIKSIVAVQQSNAGVSGVVEAVQIPNLLEDAFLLVQSTAEQLNIEVVRELEEIGEIFVEKQKLVQVLVNLIKNAVEAISESGNDEKRLTLRVKKLADQNLRIEVQDSGIGIKQENLCNVFTHGFTTKEDGHGFGLHSSANAITEMGGSLNVASEGEGKGTTFIVEIPYELTTGAKTAGVK